MKCRCIIFLEQMFEKGGDVYADSGADEFRK